METIANHENHKPRMGIFTFLLNGVQFNAFVTNDDMKWHASISNEGRDMTYAEIKHCRYMLLPDDIEAAMIFPPKDQFVNIHPYCFHLYEI